MKIINLTFKQIIPNPELNIAVLRVARVARSTRCAVRLVLFNWGFGITAGFFLFSVISTNTISAATSGIPSRSINQTENITNNQNNNSMVHVKKHSSQMFHKVSPKFAMYMGRKIWMNECNGKISGLMSWNDGENFVSLGIGHFIWRPATKGCSAYDEFPILLDYIKRRGVTIPMWLDSVDTKCCPWNNKDEFLRNTNSQQMLELQALLVRTIGIQSEYMVYNLKIILPKLLSSSAASDRPYICRKFYSLSKTKKGLFAMMDYLNFKGSGAIKLIETTNDDNQQTPPINKNGHGLLQVIINMKNAPENISSGGDLATFIWSAKAILQKHAQTATFDVKDQYTEWLPGWVKRVEGYK